MHLSLLGLQESVYFIYFLYEVCDVSEFDDSGERPSKATWD